jgi:hypothetical protein
MTLDWSQCPGVESDPEKMSGAWVFRGTRFPISTIFENLEQGATIRRYLGMVSGAQPPANSRSRGLRRQKRTTPVVIKWSKCK